jgi:polyribonucleotide nucleotidyltransferase
MKDSTFDMAVAGRVLRRRRRRDHDGRGRRHRGHRRNVRAGKTAPTEEIVGQGLEAAKPFIKALCEAQAELANQLPKET